MFGTVHVDPASGAAVRDTIVALKPEVVALELDEARMMGLENPKAQSGRGAGGSFLTMALLERFAGQMTGAPPGTERLEAAKAARAVGSRAEVMHVPITNTGASLNRVYGGTRVCNGLLLASVNGQLKGNLGFCWRRF